jgi:Ulp1 family protease
MSRFDCPLLDRIMSHWESLADTECTFDTLTPSKLRLIETEFPPYRPRPTITVQKRDLACLSGREWINDEVLNSYISLVTCECDYNIGYTNSFFYKKLERDGCEAAAPWHGIKNQPISRYETFLVPICKGIHWIMAVFDFVEGQLAILDSLHGQHEDVAGKLNEFLAWQGGEMLPVIHPEVPTQRNGDDCGVFVMAFAKCLCAGESLDSFGQRDIPRIRAEIRRRLVEVMGR